MKVFPCKLGTQPARVQFRYAYKLRPGLRVTYRKMYTRDIPWGSWETAIVDSINPLFLSKF